MEWEDVKLKNPAWGIRSEGGVMMLTEVGPSHLQLGDWKDELPAEKSAFSSRQTQVGVILTSLSLAKRKTHGIPTEHSITVSRYYSQPADIPSLRSGPAHTTLLVTFGRNTGGTAKPPESNSQTSMLHAYSKHGILQTPYSKP